jgi:uncharacterized protein YndB with AHSA1/START domain
MPDSNHATFSEHGGRPALRFERVLAQPPERVWSALTGQQELLAWHPTPFELEPTQGGAVRFRAAPGSPAMPDGLVLDYEPPRLLAYTWGEDELRFELAPHEDGCLLNLTHSFDDRFKAARDAAGWHVCLDALDTSLASPARAPEGPRPPEVWSSLNVDYEQRFGIAPEQATPPPPR